MIPATLLLRHPGPGRRPIRHFRGHSPPAVRRPDNAPAELPRAEAGAGGFRALPRRQCCHLRHVRRADPDAMIPANLTVHVRGGPAGPIRA